jgi:hypothetical protein
VYLGSPRRPKRNCSRSVCDDALLVVPSRTAIASTSFDRVTRPALGQGYLRDDYCIAVAFDPVSLIPRKTAGRAAGRRGAQLEPREQAGRARRPALRVPRQPPDRALRASPGRARGIAMRAARPRNWTRIIGSRRATTTSDCKDQVFDDLPARARGELLLAIIKLGGCLAPRQFELSVKPSVGVRARTSI